MAHDSAAKPHISRSTLSPVGRETTRPLRQALARLRRQFDAVARASQIDALTSGNVEAAARRIVELGAEITGCARVNAWVFNADESELHCIACYEAEARQHTSGMILREPDFRNEFRALRHSRYVDANEPLTDPRTAGYAESYLKPLRITSMLDAVVRVSGQNLGLLCFEHVDRPHRWEQDEISFACQLADKLGLALVTRVRLQAEERLQLANTLLKVQMETSREAMLAVDTDGRVISLNQRFADSVHQSPEALIGADSREMLRASAPLMKNPEVYLARVMHFVTHPDESGTDELELVDGRCIDRHTAVLKAPSGQRLGRVWFFRDITDRKRDEARMLYTATHDQLTGLVNRSVFAQAVAEAIAATGRGGQAFAVLYLDLDHFKDINDTLGHPVGDEFLRTVAQRLRANTRGTDTVARFGGDEFAVIARAIGQPADAAVLAATLVAAMKQPFWIRGNEIRSGASVGVSVYGPGVSAAETLLSQADVALYRAKAEGRGVYRFFTDAMDDEVRTRVRLRTELQHALDRREFFLLFQPQVDLASGTVTGVEALVRWRHPVHGVLEPGLFIPVAEESGLIVGIGDWVLEEACRQARAWMDLGLELGRVGVNLSAVHFKVARDLERTISRVLDETRLPPDRLELELTETVLMVASREYQDVLARLRQRGIRLAIDDFGTGYSSLDYLRRFPVDRLKIAQEFVSQVLGGGTSGAIVKATLGLARELGIGVIAEGVDSDEQLRLLQRWGCREAQGFCFAPPLPPEQVLPLLRSRDADATPTPAPAA